MMEAIYCACVLANIEGQKHQTPLPDRALTLTLAALDDRTQKLEGLTKGLLAPPPSTPLTWDSLAWRVARLAAQAPCVLTLPCIPEVPLSPSTELLDSIVRSLINKSPGIIPQKGDLKRASQLTGDSPGDDGDAEDDEKTVCDDKDADEKKLNIIRQRLCFAVGKRNRKIARVPYDLSRTCSLGLHLSLDIEKNLPPGPVRMPAPPGWNGPPRPIVVNRRCACTCHGKKHRMRPSPSFGRRVGRFFGKLAFWKRSSGNDSDSDTASYCGSDSSSSSGTSIVDH